MNRIGQMLNKSLGGISMTELQVLRWFENPKEPEPYESDISRCRRCNELEGECSCIDDWKILD